MFDLERTYQRFGPQGMTIFSFQVRKAGTQFEVQLATLPTQVEGSFLALALNYMTELVGQRPASDFAANTQSTFYCCVSGRWQANALNQIIYSQKYTCRSLTREEVFFVIRSIRNNIEAWETPDQGNLR